jgi:THAP domain
MTLCFLVRIYLCRPYWGLGESVIIYVAAGCSNNKKDKSLSFYRFPGNKERRSRWIAAVKRAGWQPTEHSRLCSSHFVGGTSADKVDQLLP